MKVSTLYLLFGLATTTIALPGRNGTTVPGKVTKPSKPEVKTNSGPIPYVDNIIKNINELIQINKVLISTLFNKKKEEEKAASSAAATTKTKNKTKTKTKGDDKTTSTSTTTTTTESSKTTKKPSTKTNDPSWLYRRDDDYLPSNQPSVCYPTCLPDDPPRSETRGRGDEIYTISVPTGISRPDPTNTPIIIIPTPTTPDTPPVITGNGAGRIGVGLLAPALAGLAVLIV
ncbi:hypothetical protein CP532_3847 [Ophiocordyceps camponoti-leonardi (nom. inval.)]|nr:hypothetical protein CP532_3847 [Ophiocordyceps camponoti-leonardi (nom. inval.)]